MSDEDIALIKYIMKLFKISYETAKKCVVEKPKIIN